MYVYGLDPVRLVFQDAFGLTCVDFEGGGRATTRPEEVEAPSLGRVAMSRSGDVISTGRFMSGKTALWRVPSMKRLVDADLVHQEGALLHPDGESFVYVPQGSTELVIAGRRGGEPSVFELSRPGRRCVREGQWLSRPNRLAVHPCGAFAALSNGVLVGGMLEGGGVRITTRRVITTEGELVLFATARGAAAVTHCRGRSVVYTPEGETLTIDSRTPAQVGGGYIAWQPSVHAIARRPLGGGAVERFPLSEEDSGLALVMPGEGALSVVPWHREDVLELVSGRRISRRLPVEHHGRRRRFMRSVHSCMVAANALALSVCWRRVVFAPGGDGIETSLFYSGKIGAREAVALEAFDEVQREHSRRAYRSVGRAMGGAFLVHEEDIGVSAVRDAVVWLERNGFTGIDLVSAFEHMALDEAARALIMPKAWSA